jgi:hypothetical protein
MTFRQISVCFAFVFLFLGAFILYQETVVKKQKAKAVITENICYNDFQSYQLNNPVDYYLITPSMFILLDPQSSFSH